MALALMTMILVASLELRVQSMRTGTDIGQASREMRQIEALFDMLINRTLPEPVRDVATSGYVWRGDHLGQPYIITRQREEVDNPVAGLDGANIDSQPQVSVFRYIITYQGEQVTMVWHR